MKLATIRRDNELRMFVEEKEITNATFSDLSECDFDFDYMGLKRVGENETGEELFESNCFDYDGKQTWDEIKDIETDIQMIRYWDGNNWQIDIIDFYYFEEIEIERNEEKEGTPKYSFSYTLTLEDGEKVQCSQSNMSGSLSPYYVEDDVLEK